MKQLLFGLLASVALGSVVGSANADTVYPYSVTDLGTMDGLGSAATAINGKGDVTGYVYTLPGSGDHAFVYTASGGMRDLGTLPGAAGDTNYFSAAINSTGQVVGWTSSPEGGSYAFLYTASGGMKDVGTLGGSAGAGGMNDAGQIVGGAQISSAGPSHAFVYTGGVMTDLGTLGGQNSAAVGINNSGQVVGWADLPTPGTDHAFFHNGQDGILDIGALLGENDLSEAAAINDRGQVLGWYADASGDHSFVWSSTNGFTMLSLPPNVLGGAINNLDQIVGSGLGADEQPFAFVYDEPDGMRDLNCLVELPAGWTITDARGINDHGQIACTETGPNGEQRALLLTPTPEPSSLALASCTLIVLLVWRAWRQRRLWATWETCPHPRCCAHGQKPTLPERPLRLEGLENRALLTTLYFSPHGTLGSDGTWSTAAEVWSPSPNGSGPLQTLAADDDAVFAGDAGTVTISGTVTAHSLRFDSTGYFIEAGTLSLATAATQITVNGDAATINSTIAGIGGLTKSGDGVLSLLGTITYQSDTTVDAGILQLGSDSPLPRQTNLTVNGGIVDLGTDDNSSVPLATVTMNAGDIANGTLAASDSINLGGGMISAALTGEAGVYVLPSASSTLAGNNTYQGGTYVSQGATLTYSFEGSIPGGPGAISGPGTAQLDPTTLYWIGNGGQQNIWDTAAQHAFWSSTSDGKTPTRWIDGDYADFGSLGTTRGITVNNTVRVAGIKFDGANTYTISNGIISLDTANTSITAGSASTTETINSSIIGTVDTAGPKIGGSGTIALTGINSYKGKTTIDTGTLSINSVSSLGTAPSTFTADQISFNSGTLATTQNDITLPSTSGITLNGNTGTFAPAATKTLTIPSVITGTGWLAMAGGGHTRPGRQQQLHRKDDHQRGNAEHRQRVPPGKSRLVYGGRADA